MALAKRFRGEIINSDAMQLYNGLPIITNKITPAEQQEVPHHLLGHIPLHETPWDVEDFKREAAKVIGEIRGRGNLPILVGGTQYYVDPLLFTDVILDDVQHTDSSKSFPILDEPTEILLKELEKCDPIMAERWHPNDRRKIQRSLEIYLHTGKPASQFYAEQQARKASAAARETSESGSWEKLLFWVHSDREVLRDRLDRRVDKMLTAGLLGEVKQLYEFKKQSETSGRNLDMTKGIWQSIGYKQLEPYLKAVEEGKDQPETEPLKVTGLEEMKAATRRYANYQTKWIRIKQMRRLQDEGEEAVGSLYLVDSTDLSRYQDTVVGPAIRITEQFLNGQPRPTPTQLSDKALEILTAAVEPPQPESPQKKTCEICNTVLVTEQAWQRHIKGTAHRRVLKRKKKLALVSVPGSREKAEQSDESRASSPEIGSMFST